MSTDLSALPPESLPEGVKAQGCPEEYVDPDGKRWPCHAPGGHGGNLHIHRLSDTAAYWFTTQPRKDTP